MLEGMPYCSKHCQRRIHNHSYFDGAEDIFLNNFNYSNGWLDAIMRTPAVAPETNSINKSLNKLSFIINNSIIL